MLFGTIIVYAIIESAIIVIAIIASIVIGNEYK